ncbi:hypothetical protein L596_013393 [Steinernema carpocapsae]|uniref:Uncharacterized protein n=1 Tax=Steinernema carpocapsae TaxID=34508 RepID=A0A4U5P021_STECR|nr:hypothetical protein L596_013393 [Steinernema carpocapsae]
MFKPFTFIWKFKTDKTEYVNGIKTVNTLKVYVLMLPITGYQIQNAKALKKAEVSLNFDRQDLSNVEKLSDAVKELLTNDRCPLYSNIQFK